MISVIIPTLNAERTLAHTLAALVPGVVEGIVQEAILVDGGSTDGTWAEEAQSFIERVESGRRPQSAASFRFALDDYGFMPRFVEGLVGLRCSLLALPYGDQGLLIPRNLYNRLGGFRPLPLMEDVDLLRRLKRRELVMLKSRAVTSGERYRREGYLTRSLRNLGCMLLYYLRVPPRVLARLYG
jgi:glycosyltransferase involved in cell wall biosynthesis